MLPKASICELLICMANPCGAEKTEMEVNIPKDLVEEITIETHEITCTIPKLKDSRIIFISDTISYCERLQYVAKTRKFLPQIPFW